MPKRKKTNKQKQSNLLPVIVILVVIAAAAVYFYTQEPDETPVAPPPEPGIEEGDLISINFILAMANGTVVDTNNETLAKEFGVNAYSKGPFRFVVSQSSKLKGFDEAFIGAQPGKIKKIISPSEQVLTQEINKIRQVSRNQPYNRFQPIKKTAFENTFSKPPIIGDVVTSEELPWPLKIINVTEKFAITEPIVQEGKLYQLPGYEWESLLLVLTHDDMLFRHMPKDGQIVNTEYGKAIVSTAPGIFNLTYQMKVGDEFKQFVSISGPISIPYDFRVTAEDEEKFTLTRINYPAQETLVLNAEILEWEQDVEKLKQTKTAPAN